jgi:hypothetical protein
MSPSAGKLSRRAAMMHGTWYSRLTMPMWLPLGSCVPMMRRASP